LLFLAHKSVFFLVAWSFIHFCSMEDENIGYAPGEQPFEYYSTVAGCFGEVIRAKAIERHIARRVLVLFTL